MDAELRRGGARIRRPKVSQALHTITGSIRGLRDALNL